jgi:hypothetical protein
VSLVPTPQPAPTALPAEQHRLLTLVFEHFSRTGDWPLVAELQRELARRGDRFDLGGVDVPRALGYRDLGRRTFCLSIEGVITVAPGSTEVFDFVDAMRLCCELYLNQDKPKLTSTTAAITSLIPRMLGTTSRLPPVSVTVSPSQPLQSATSHRKLRLSVLLPSLGLMARILRMLLARRSTSHP